VWAPDHQNVEVILESEDHAPGHEVCRRLRPEKDGYFGGYIREARAGALYRFRLDGGPQSYPDPASRFQPLGPHGSPLESPLLCRREKPTVRPQAMTCAIVRPYCSSSRLVSTPVLQQTRRGAARNHGKKSVSDAKNR
jgi:hypothetical protein